MSENGVTMSNHDCKYKDAWIIAWGLVTFLMGLAVFVLAVRLQDASLKLEQLKHVKPCIEAKP